MKAQFLALPLLLLSFQAFAQSRSANNGLGGIRTDAYFMTNDGPIQISRIRDIPGSSDSDITTTNNTHIKSGQIMYNPYLEDMPSDKYVVTLIPATGTGRNTAPVLKIARVVKELKANEKTVGYQIAGDIGDQKTISTQKLFAQGGRVIDKGILRTMLEQNQKLRPELTWGAMETALTEGKVKGDFASAKELLNIVQAQPGYLSSKFAQDSALAASGLAKNMGAHEVAGMLQGKLPSAAAPDIGVSIDSVTTKVMREGRTE